MPVYWLQVSLHPANPVKVFRDFLPS
jgi:hypothetical protein